MAEYLSPAVYIEEKSSGIKPIQGVGTSTAAFIGHAEKGTLGTAVPVNNFAEFQKKFGGYIDDSYLAFTVKAFFDEGGTSCYVVRTCHYVNNMPMAFAAWFPSAYVLSGLADCKVAPDDGFRDFRFAGTGDVSAYLVSYDGTDALTLTASNDPTVTQTATLSGDPIAAGETETAVFPSLGATVVLDNQFAEATAIGIDANTATVTAPPGTPGVIDESSIVILGVTGDISAITSTELTIEPVDVTDITGDFSVTVNGFRGTFSNFAIGLKEVELEDTGGNVLEIAFNLDPVFDGTETAITIDLQHLENLVVAKSTPLTVRALSAGAWGNDISIAITHGAGDLFDLEVNYRGANVENFTGLTMDPAHDDYVEDRINGGNSNYITVKDNVPTGSVLTMAQRRPGAVSPAVNLSGGDNGLESIAGADYIGNELLGTGMHAFDKIDGINILAVPDAFDPEEDARSVHIAGMTYCENRGDCFFIADSQSAVDTADSVLNFKFAQGEYAGGNAINSKYGALYTPWISVFDPRNSGTILIPPSGSVAGIYARTDGARGVHKAPAGITDGKFRTALDVEKEFTDADQAKLNPKGINVIRKLKGTGIVAWGARTVSSDPEWRYLNIRRLFLFLEESIEESTKWVVFEPNDPALWKSITRNVSAFLKLQWMKGALVGNTEEEAFYVKCDQETNPPESVDLGRVITEIGVAPSKPAEFVIFRIAQWQSGSEVSE
jgi:phage tail sheath protein FI